MVNGIKSKTVHHKMVGSEFNFRLAPLVVAILLIVSLLECGSTSSYSIGSRIVGGVHATEGEFPYLVSLQMNPVFGHKYHYCGGSILNETHIISAAHCVDGRAVNQIQVLAGAYILQAGVNDSTFEQRRNVISTTLHPQFDNLTLRYDIALIYLSEPLQFTTRVKPIRLSASDTDYIGNCTVAGWGTNLTPGGPSVEPTFLQKVNMTRVALLDCKSSYEFIHHVDDTMVCASGENEIEMQGPCSGDNGGPLLCVDAKNNDTVISGIMSWGMIPCGNSAYPSIYTNVSTWPI